MSTARKYHHGNLKTELTKAARIELELNGLAGISLRKCAERVRVSPMAPKNHFGNMAGLLTAIVTQGYAELAASMVENVQAETSREERRHHALLGYVNFAKANPALYELMFARDRVVNDDLDLMNEVRKCFLILEDISRELGWYDGTEIEQNGKGQIALWSFVHGYAQLSIAGRFKKDNMQGLDITDVFPML